jgi:hypothetical protein
VIPGKLQLCLLGVERPVHSDRSRVGLRRKQSTERISEYALPSEGSKNWSGRLAAAVSRVITSLVCFWREASMHQTCFNEAGLFCLSLLSRAQLAEVRDSKIH